MHQERLGPSTAVTKRKYSIEAVRYKDNSFSELLSDIQGVKEQGVLKCWSAVVTFSACYAIKGW